MYVGEDSEDGAKTRRVRAVCRGIIIWPTHFAETLLDGFHTQPRQQQLAKPIARFWGAWPRVLMRWSPGKSKVFKNMEVVPSLRRYGNDLRVRNSVRRTAFSIHGGGAGDATLSQLAFLTQDYLLRYVCCHWQPLWCVRMRFSMGQARGALS